MLPTELWSYKLPNYDRKNLSEIPTMLSQKVPVKDRYDEGENVSGEGVMTETGLVKL